MRRSRTRDRAALEALVATLERAGLRGHGGASFPTATKLRAVAAQPRRPIVVVNGCEGEPLSVKDRFLLTHHTDEVLDGTSTTARALGAERIVVAIDARAVGTLERVEATIARRARAGLTRPGAGPGGPPIAVVGVPGGFVSGQETALVNVLNGGPAKPTGTPPYPFQRGVDGRPTLVSNVETFRQIGRLASGLDDGGRCVTVSGAVPRRTVVQLRRNTTLAEALDASGGIVEPISAVLLGGYGGSWAAVPEALALRLEEPALRARGLTLGAGIVHAFAASRCPVAEVARVTAWMAAQSAGQCGPCVFGLTAIAEALAGLCGGAIASPGRTVGRGAALIPSSAPGPDRAALVRVERWCTMVAGRGGCAHPDGVSRYVSSALTVFGAAFAEHAADGPCPRCRAEAVASARRAQLPARAAGSATARFDRAPTAVPA